MFVLQTSFKTKKESRTNFKRKTHSPNQVMSRAQDGTVRVWDVRADARAGSVAVSSSSPL